MKKSLSKYVKVKKDDSRLDPTVVTAVNIKVSHKEFIIKNNLNLSMMVRDMLDSVVHASKKSKEG